jgi:hypothetical protein
MDLVLPESPKRSRSTKSKGFVVAMAAVLTLLLIIGTVEKLVYRTPGWVELRENRDAQQFYLNEEEDLNFVSKMTYIKPKPVGIDGDRDKTSDLEGLSKPKPSEDFGSLESIWRCKDEKAKEGRSSKLIYLHLPDIEETSVFRAILEAYSHHCHAGMAVVSTCSSPSVKSMKSGNWQNSKGRRAGEPCRIRKVLERDLTEFYEQQHVNMTFLQSDIDVLVGNFPIGVDSYWKDASNNPINAQYITLLQDPVSLYVGRFNNGKTLPLNQTADDIKRHVQEQHKYGRVYSQYPSYLITAEQFEDFQKAGVIPSHKSAAFLAMKNLLDSNVLVGIAERMPESIEMLKHVVDRTSYLDKMFEYFGMRNATGIAKKVIRSRSSKIVKELEKDKEFMIQFREFVRWDAELYDFALDLHKRQYNLVKEMKGKSM